MADYLKLVSARVTNFACFEDTGEVPIDPQVTVLLAENENGKSSFLRALGWFSEVDREFDTDDRWDGADPNGALDIVALTFQTIPSAVSALKEKTGISLPKRIRVVRRTDGSYRVEDEATGEELSSVQGFAFKWQHENLIDFLRRFTSESDLSAEREEAIRHVEAAREADGPTIETAVSYVRSYVVPHLDEAPSAELEELCTGLEDPDDPLLRVLDDFLPTTIYFGEDVEELNDVVTYIEVGSNPERYQTMINLATLVGEDLDSMASLSAHERQRRSRTASTTVTEGVSKYWAEGDITVHITFDETQMVVSITHKERDQKPSRRSRGLRWFLGFYVNFSARTKEDLTGAVLLLDEPGIFLHLRQQTKFLQLLDVLARSNQIIYSTQLPKMVPVAKLHRLRFLVPDDEAVHTVTVKSKLQAFGSKADVTQPVRAQLGMGIAESISLGNVNVVVEGLIDPYLLDTMSVFCREADKPSLADDVTLFATGGSGKKMLPHVATLVGDPVKGVVLLDDDKAGHAAQREIKKVFGDLVPTLRVVEGGSTPSGKEIEDIVSRTYYLELTNAAYKGRVTGYVEIGENDVVDGPIVDAIEAVFKSRRYGTFQKVYPARELQVRLQIGESGPDDETLENFGTLFERVNTALAATVQA